MHSLARAGERVSVSDDSAAALGSALSPVLLQSFPVEILFPDALTQHQPAAGSAELLAADFKILFKTVIFSSLQRGNQNPTQSITIFHLISVTT